MKKKTIYIAVAALACALGAIFCITSSNGTIKVGLDGVTVEVEEDRTQLDRIIDKTDRLWDNK
jgi:hypothetical protein